MKEPQYLTDPKPKMQVNVEIEILGNSTDNA